MNRVLAYLAVAALSYANLTAMFWYVFGVWPRSWPLLFLFTITSSITSMLATHVIKGED